MKNKNLYTGLLIVSLSSLYYLYMFFVRVLPSVMTRSLMQDLNITSVGFGLITLSFVGAYAFVQIPSGLIIDRIGARKTLIFGMLGCIIGSYLFQISSSIHLIILSRIILGISCGAAFIAPMAMVKQWLPKHMFSTAAGMIQVLGCIGAMLTSPISSLVEQIGWRDTGAYAMFIAILLFILFLLGIKEYKAENVEQSAASNSIAATLNYIIKDIKYWHVGLIAITSWAIIGGFAEAWGVTFLSQVQNISLSEASEQLIWVWIGVAVSSPLGGLWSEHTHNKAIPLVVLYLSGTIAFLLILSASIHNKIIMSFLLFLTGMSAGGQPIAFGLISDISPKHMLATSVSFCNVCVIAGAFTIQPIVSIMLDLLWDGAMVNGIASYSITQYQYSFLPIVIIMICGIFASLSPPLQNESPNAK